MCALDVGALEKDEACIPPTLSGGKSEAQTSDKSGAHRVVGSMEEPGIVNAEQSAWIFMREERQTNNQRETPCARVRRGLGNAEMATYAYGQKGER